MHMDHPNFVSDDSSSSSVDPMFSGVTLQSILSLNPSLHLPSVPFHFADNNTPSIVPKSEPNLFEYLPTTSHYPFDFFSTTHCPPTFYDPSSTFLPLPLPQLHSLESFPLKRPRFDSLIPTPPQISSPMDSPAGDNSSPVIPQSNLARQRRQKLSDKTRCLQKLMPWDKKMDQATLLEEACKYVKFLQAQFNALQSMPSYSPLQPHSSESSVQNGHVFGDLERLNRNQVLQVLVNSPVAQTRLYSQGFCVFSIEQLTLLSNVTGKRLLLPQVMSDNASSKSFFN